MNANIYSELLDILQQKPEGWSGGLFGTLAAVSPLTVRVRGRDINRGLFYPRGKRFYPEDIGAMLALLPCEEGFFILDFAEGGDA